MLERSFHAKRRGALDHEELALIREAIEVQLWRELGMVSIREYLERRLGYTPGVASERVRVAEALEAMPALEQAHAAGELSYSAVREITRIATRRTERAWLAKVLEAMGLAFLRGESATSTRAPTQIAISMCPSCKVARQNGAGVEIAIPPAAFERAACDAQWLGNVDGERARAVQDVTPATRTFVFARDKHRCRVPRCRSARNLEIHHIVHREDGGSHEPSNLVCLCSGHHDAHHNGTLIIRGTADALEVLRLDEGPVDTSTWRIRSRTSAKSRRSRPTPCSR